MSAPKVVLVLAPLNFRDDEYKKPRNVFEQAGFRVEVASAGFMEARGMLGTEVAVDVSPADVDVDAVDAVVFASGPGLSRYFSDPAMTSLARRAFEGGRVLGAVSIGQMVLANAGVLAGRRATVWSSGSDLSFVRAIKDAGAVYVPDERVVADGNLVTAVGPEDSQAFAEKVVEIVTGRA